jgi:hypothetical protein
MSNILRRSVWLLVSWIEDLATRHYFDNRRIMALFARRSSGTAVTVAVNQAIPFSSATAPLKRSAEAPGVRRKRTRTSLFTVSKGTGSAETHPHQIDDNKIANEDQHQNQ